MMAATSQVTCWLPSPRPTGHDTSTAHFSTQLTGCNSGEAFDINQPLELRTDGKLYKVSGAGNFVGISPRTVGVPNQAITPRGIGLRFHARDEGDLTVGATYFLGATAGYISDTATARDSMGAFTAISKYDLLVVKQGKVV